MKLTEDARARIREWALTQPDPTGAERWMLNTLAEAPPLSPEVAAKVARILLSARDD